MKSKPLQFGLGSIFRLTTIAALLLWLWQMQELLGSMSWHATISVANQSDRILMGLVWLPVPLLIGAFAVEFAARTLPWLMDLVKRRSGLR